jgi:hypothetical protein
VGENRKLQFKHAKFRKNMRNTQGEVIKRLEIQTYDGHHR